MRGVHAVKVELSRYPVASINITFKLPGVEATSENYECLNKIRPLFNKKPSRWMVCETLKC